MKPSPPKNNAPCSISVLIQVNRMNNTLTVAMLKRRGMAAIEEGLRRGPIHIVKRNDAATLGRYDAFFVRADLIWVELTRDVVELAAAVRVRHGLRTPDAMQAACCLQLGADHIMLTGGGSVARVAGLKVVQLH